ncbi:MAG: ABC transporter permease [Acidimicrobiia bacterium]|nr:ABC transporter permease [Acidimicrobiia bacterium]
MEAPSRPQTPAPVALQRWTVLRPGSSKRPWASAAATRELLWESAARELRGRYKQNVGKGVWMLVQPIAMVLIYGFVFTQIFKATGHGLPYLSMAWAGIICWQFFQHGVQIGMFSVIFEAGTLSKVWFPRVVVPLTPGTAAFADLGLGFVVLFLVATVQGVSIGITAVALVVPVAMLAVWMFALALLLAPLAVFLRDLTSIVPLLLRLGFFASPIMYSVFEIPEQFSWLATWNPVAVAVTGVRDAVLAGVWPDWRLIGIHAVAGLVLLAATYTYFTRVEDRLVDAL